MFIRAITHEGGCCCTEYRHWSRGHGGRRRHAAAASHMNTVNPPMSFLTHMQSEISAPVRAVIIDISSASCPPGTLLSSSTAGSCVPFFPSASLPSFYSSITHSCFSSLCDSLCFVCGGNFLLPRLGGRSRRNSKEMLP